MPEDKSFKVLPYIFNVMKNPSLLGGSSVYKNLRIEKKLNAKYTEYIKKNETLGFTLYADPRKEEYLYHFQVVSDKDPEVVYDVLILFYTKDKDKKEQNSLEEYDFKIFSNSPGFCFQFAYVYNKGGYIIDDLKKKINMIDTPPSKTNPNNAYGYDYPLYFAMYFLYLNKSYIKKKEIARIAKPLSQFDKEDILSSYEAYKKRNPKQFSTFEKIKKKTKSILDIPKKGIEAIKKGIGIVPTRKATKPIKATKATRASRHKVFK